MIELEPLVNKRIPLKFNGAELRFDLSHALFSSFDVDAGTRLLLKTIARDPVLAAARRVLDAGCGTGILGLAVAKAFPEAEVTLRDRDSLAAAFSDRNRLINKLRDSPARVDPETGERRPAYRAPQVGLGLLADGREGGPYDYVISNLPAKAGGPVLEAFFLRAGSAGATPGLLAPGGRLAVVIVHPLADAASLWIEKAGLAVVATARGSMHKVFVCERATSAVGAASGDAADSGGADAPPPGARSGVGAGADTQLDLDGIDMRAYVRREGRFRLGAAGYPARGFWGLPEFDTPSFGTALAADLAERVLAGSLVRAALIVNPGIGHLALWAAKRLGTSVITGASRDLLSLAATGANLAAVGGATYRAVDSLRLDELPGPSQDLLLDAPDIVPGYDWIEQSWKRAEQLVKSGGTYLAICPPTEIARLEKRRASGWRLLGERRKRGASVMAWRRG